MNAPAAPSLRLAANASLVGAVLLWSSFYGIMEELLRGWDVFSLTAVRLTLGSVILCLMLLLREGKGAFLRPLPWGRIAILGGVGFGLFCIFITMGILYAGAIASAFVFTTSPIVTAFVARIAVGQRLGPGTLMGAVLALAGGTLMVLKDGAVEIRGGEILVLGCVICFSWYSIMLPRWLPGLSTVAAAAFTVSAGTLVTIVLAPAALLAGLVEFRVDLSSHSLLLLVYLAVTTICLAVMLWNFGVRHLGATMASIYSNLSPVFAACIAMALGIYPTLMQVAGGLVILAGVIVAQRWRAS
ncbi:MAG: DMT family transporter [Alphaproteobacteria bacterium]